MNAANATPTGGTPAIRLHFRADRFNAAMARLGFHTANARARAAGVSKHTLIRWRFGRFTGMPSSAYRVAAAAGLTVDQLFEAAPVADPAPLQAA